MLLMLLWRHLVCYVGGKYLDKANQPNLRASDARMARLPEITDSEAFCRELRRRMAPILQRLVMARFPFFFSIEETNPDCGCRNLKPLATTGFPLENTLKECGGGCEIL